MEHICIYCKLIYEGRKNKIYCSDNCREKFRYHNKRKGNPEYLIKQRRREKRWYLKGGKLVKQKYQRTPKFRNIQNKWRRDKKYWLEQYEKHPENNRSKGLRYKQTDKGKVNTLKCNERRRKKNLILTGKSLDKLDTTILNFIRERDNVCVYCGEPFNEKVHRKKETIDHLDPNKPLSLNNAVRCCWSCNASKRVTPLDKLPEWIKRKNFNPSPIISELIKIKN